MSIMIIPFSVIVAVRLCVIVMILRFKLELRRYIKNTTRAPPVFIKIHAISRNFRFWAHLLMANYRVSPETA